MGNKNLSSSELSFFCMQVALVLKSGMLIYDGINMMCDEMENGKVKDSLLVIKEELKNRIPLYKAMEKSNCFPPYLINMCHVGSLTGTLEDVLKSLSEYYDREELLKLRVKNSIFYPTMLFIMMSCVIILLVTKIFPIFESMLKELGGEISSEASVLLSFSTGIMAGKFTMYLVIAIIVLIISCFLVWKTEKGKISFNSLLSNFFLTKSIINKITAFRFSSSMSLLLSSGMNMDKSVNLLIEILQNSELKNKVELLKNSMDQGNSFIESLSRLNIYSKMHMQMLNLGSKTGEIDNVMKKLTHIYENEADEALSHAVALIEPVLIGILSIAIGIILISVMIPLMNIMSSIG